ncbi:hypothetical protein THZG08_860001 [Vibrio owensii]|uniref:hypothetical protein n=1 Tax=Vibrio owensii TaxID=696485 RepID=UPI002895DF4E|nr:hypothetical protein THZG08_860001 [Vibrio owensii]CAH1593258.1 hypothetical protein THOA03_850001 [Vibrio owensii]
MLVKDNDSNIKMETFEVSFSGDSFLYANGRQQIKLQVKARKQIKNDDGLWETQPLTQGEKDSIELVTIGEHLSAEQVDISFSQQSNGYEFGQWLRGSEPSQEKPIVRDDGFDFIDVYASTSTTEPHEMVAFINLDGDENWWYSDDLGDTNTSVTIQGVEPYKVTADQMLLDFDQPYNYEWAKNFYTDVDIYYWQLPSGLYYKSLSLEQVEAFGGGEDGYFYTQCVPRIQHCRLIASDVNSLTVYQTVGRGVESYLQGAGVPNDALNTFSQSTSKLIATRHISDIAPNLSTHDTGGGIFHFIDAYGCEHKLKAFTENSGVTISLCNA